MDDKRRTDTQEDIDLSEMINEYSQDNELRRKIEEMKKQKEEEKRIYESRLQASPQESIFDSISDTGTFTRPETANQKEIPDIRVDDTQVEKTRVGFEDNRAYDKTLVIMEHENSASPNETMYDSQAIHTQGVPVYGYEEKEAEEPYEGDDNDNLFAKRKDKKQHRDEEQHMNQADDEDGEDDASSVKMNKIITYVIIGIVGLCIVVGAFFGVKYMLSNFLGGSDDKTSEVEKNTEETNKNEEQEETDTPDDDQTNNIETNQAEAARLEKQLDQYQQQLDEVNKELATAQAQKDNAQKELDSYSTLYNEAVQLTAQAQDVWKALDQVNKKREEVNNANDADKRSELEKELETLEEQYQSLLSAYGVSDYNEIYSKSQQANTNYNTKVQAAEKKKSDAQATIDSLNSRKTELESKIADLTTKLDSYQ